MAKINFYLADRNMTDDVVNFVVDKVERTAINKKYNAEIKALEAKIVFWNEIKIASDEEKQTKIKELQAELEKLNDEHSIELARYKYTPTQADKAFKKRLEISNGDTTTMALAFIKWLNESWNLPTDDLNFAMSAITNARSTSQNITRFIESDGKKILKLSANGTLKNCYCYLYETLCELQLIKPAQIPSILLDDYLKKLEEKLEREEARKKKAKNKK